ncbi:hypothetical protein RDABS01_038518 [Bienertia sinuspersici]
MKVVDVIQVTQEDSTKSNVKRALLVAKKKERINLPLYKNANVGEMYHISQFLKHPTGVESILNVNALESYVLIDANIYRCKVPPIQLLNFEVALYLIWKSVQPFEGSEIVTSQNKYFAATMKNFITWEDTDSESFLDVDVKLNITLEIYNRPFTLLPVSAVEGPGNLVLQALLDRLVPLLLQQLLQDYDAWVKQQCTTLP